MTYADVIVPVPIDGLFTYSVPAQLAGKVSVGMRVVVQFGKSKEYSAIVARVHGDTPATGIAVKPIIDVIDSTLSVTEAQISFWKWMASYYLCSIGEVMIAAMPAGMKLSSESVVTINPDAPAAPDLTPTEQAMADFIAEEGRMSIRQLERSTRRKNVITTVRSLYDKQVVKMGEELSSKFKPRCETRVAPAPGMFSESKLNAALDSLGKAPSQQRVLLSYLDLSAASAALKLNNAALLRPVSKAALLKESGTADTALRELCRKGILITESVPVTRLKSAKGALMPPHALSEAQQKAYDSILESFGSKDVCLLYGITSSGKTEIYIHLIARALAEGKSVLYLLPEIALTTQITSRLRLFFGDKMGVYHSKFPDNERVEIWKKQMSAQPYRLIVGVRSSLFLPHRNLGLVIVDEEHEPSYKQADPAPRYNARDAAIMLASMQGAKTLLGTATPSLESFTNATNGKYALVKLEERYGKVNLPQIKVENVKELRRTKMMKTSLSPDLIEEMKQALASGQQAILFQNRRGFSSYIECSQCGWIPRCEKCDVSLTYHKASNMLVCHYCGTVYNVPQRCPKCGGHKFGRHGVGTEQVESDVKAAFPNAKTARLDLDTTRGRNAYENILSDFRSGKTDILIGTQMVSKGLDFDRVKVVGILDADTELNVPDFRAHERAFQMMSQVAGRAGRRDSQGIVVLQTSTPDADIIGYVAGNKYNEMYKAQMSERKAFLFPPYCRLIYIYVRSRYAERADKAAQALAQQLQPVFGENLLGPASPPVARVKLMHIRQIMLKVPLTASVGKVRTTLRLAAAKLKESFNVDIYYDVDPL